MNERRDERVSIVRRIKLEEGVVEGLRGDIEAGVWGEYLPGVRKLMQRYGVSRPPVEAALVQLESEGMLAAAQLRKRRQIIRKESGVRRGGMVLVRPPFSQLSALSREVLTRLEPYLREAGYAYEEFAVDEHRRGEGEDHRVRSVRGDEAVIGLDMSHGWMRERFPFPCPMLLLGGKAFEDSECAAVGLRMGEAIEEAVYHALMHGCREVCLAEVGLPRGVRTKFGGYVERAYARAKKPYHAAFHTPHLEASKVGMRLREAVLGRPIDMVLTTKEYAWSRVIYELQCAGIAVPVKNMLREGTFSLFDVSPAVVSPVLEDYDRGIQEWLESMKVGRRCDFSRGVRTRPC
ncbi:GntR family transcriptional regulator [Rubritalea tangerina]|uniref:GntR family transcriptional regulator n=2 Tax=Rubritalea tangerina TaxID=430798 RepID=A0ABW4ZE07_9BACT